MQTITQNQIQKLCESNIFLSRDLRTSIIKNWHTYQSNKQEEIFEFLTQSQIVHTNILSQYAANDGDAAYAFVRALDSIKKNRITQQETNEQSAIIAQIEAEINNEINA